MTKIIINEPAEIATLQTRITELEKQLRELRAMQAELRVENVKKTLADAGVVLGKTKVKVWEPAYWGGKSFLRPGPYIPMLVRPSGKIEFAKLKKDGSPSAASSGLSGYITEIEVIE